MKEIWFLALLPGAACLPLLGQGTHPCLPQGKSVTVRGTLTTIDEDGYRRWIDLRPVRPFCALADPADQYSDAVDRVNGVQVVTVDREDVRSRLDRLVGHKAALTGTLREWHTGYQRAAIVLLVDAVQPIDSAGEAALRVTDRPKPVRDVAVYYVTIRAGRKLAIKAQEAGSNEPLVPVNEYAPHWVCCRSSEIVVF